MDIVKVHYDEELQGVYGDDCRYLFDVSEKKLGEEVVKRINMHDELVNALQDVKDFTDWLYTKGAAGTRPKKPLNEIAKNITELLERCK